MLQGKRVTLRGVTRDDLLRQWAFNNDVEFELAGGGDPPLPQSLERLQAQFDENAAKGGRDGAFFAIDVDGVFIGQCGLFNFDDTARTCELGIGIGDKAYWNKGYGREAVALLLDYAFRLRNLHKVWLSTHGANERAARAYAACGFVEEGRMREHVWHDGRYVDLIYMGILRREWHQQHLDS